MLAEDIYTIPDAEAYPFAYRHSFGDKLNKAAQKRGITAGQLLAQAIRQSDSGSDAARNMDLDRSQLEYHCARTNVQYVRICLPVGANPDEFVRRVQLPMSARPAIAEV